MDLFKEWQVVTKEKFSTQTIKKEEIMQAISKESSLTINELKKRLKYKLYWALFFSVLFSGWFAFSLSYPTVLPLIGVLILTYGIGAVLLWNQYKQMDDQIDFSQDTLTSMKKNAQLMKKALKHENYFGLVTFPIAIICGLIIGDLYEGQTLMEAFANDLFAIKLVVCMIVLAPLMHILSNKMNDTAYGSYMKRLDENIGKMENI